MLQDYRDLAISLKEKFQSIKYWPEIELNEKDIQKIKELEDVTEVSKHSFQIKIETNHCVIPSQYILYAICVKELALAVKEHLDVFELIRSGKSNNEIGQILNDGNYDLNNIKLDEYSKTLALKIFKVKELNQDAKSIVNGTPGNYTIRGLSDFYTSIILKPINIPQASSSILGKFIYNLSKKPELYSYLEKRFSNKIPYILKEKKINKFVKGVISYLLQYDQLSGINNFIVKNSDPSFSSIKDGEISLTSIFKISKHLLDDESLSQGGRTRYFKDPLFFNIDNEFIYLSTEWTDDKESRLDLSNLIKLIEKHYPEFTIIKENDLYILKNRNTINSYQGNGAIFKSDDIINSLIISGLKISKELVFRFTSSLLTKPFVILTGLSGSGKTKLAQAFAMWICENNAQYKIVPVGADWTNREPLLGFPNALQPETYVKPDSGVLDLIIAAKANPEKPYFLILDEMNLSHVERYFADFLSTMESDEELLLHAGDENWGDVPAKIKLHKNLFIIGTVNIDETTYMFSPKVLDRANVIEFRVTKEEMSDYLSQSGQVHLDTLKGKGAAMEQSFVQIAANKEISYSKHAEMTETLVSFFEQLKVAGAEFGYRTASEIKRFAAVTEQLETGWSTAQILDAAIMQKLLPKLHGSRRKLEPVLKTLISLCIAKGEKPEDYIAQTHETESAKVLYPVSLEKIQRMYRGLIDNGFTSYAEA